MRRLLSPDQRLLVAYHLGRAFDARSPESERLQYWTWAGRIVRGFELDLDDVWFVIASTAVSSPVLSALDAAFSFPKPWGKRAGSPLGEVALWYPRQFAWLVEESQHGPYEWLHSVRLVNAVRSLCDPELCLN